MPCRECGGSAKEDGSGGVVAGLQYDDDGEASYYCLGCTLAMLEETS